jgi:hypothetical protein
LSKEQPIFSFVLESLSPNIKVVLLGLKQSFRRKEAKQSKTMEARETILGKRPTYVLSQMGNIVSST